MDPLEKEAITLSWDYICPNTTATNEILLHFIPKKMLTLSEKEKISKLTTEGERSTEMYNHVMKKKGAWPVLITALSETCNTGIALRLEGKLKELSGATATGEEQPYSGINQNNKAAQASRPDVVAEEEEKAEPGSSSGYTYVTILNSSHSERQENDALNEAIELSGMACQNSESNDHGVYDVTNHDSDSDDETVTGPFLASAVEPTTTRTRIRDLPGKYRYEIGCAVLLACLPGLFGLVIGIMHHRTQVQLENIVLSSSLEAETTRAISSSSTESDLVVLSSVAEPTPVSSVTFKATTSEVPTTTQKGSSAFEFEVKMRNNSSAPYIFEIDNPARNPLLIPPNKNEVTVILQPTQIYDLKGSWNTLNNSEKVKSLTLKGKFNLQDVVYFLEVFKNLVRLEISDGKLLCDCLDEFNFDDDTTTHVISSITNILISDILQPCDNLYRLFTRKVVKLPNLKHLTLENVSIQHENVVLVDKLFQMYASNIQSLLLNIVLCANCILFESLKLPSLTNASLNFTPIRYSGTTWATLENLSVASPNMVTFSSNMQCLQNERNILLKNWVYLYTIVDVCG